MEALGSAKARIHKFLTTTLHGETPAVPAEQNAVWVPSRRSAWQENRTVDQVGRGPL